MSSSMIEQDVFADSGRIKLALSRKAVKPSIQRDDIEGIRLPQESYRLMLYCQSSPESSKQDKQRNF